MKNKNIFLETIRTDRFSDPVPSSNLNDESMFIDDTRFFKFDEEISSADTSHDSDALARELKDVNQNFYYYHVTEDVFPVKQLYNIIVSVLEDNINIILFINCLRERKTPINISYKAIAEDKVMCRVMDWLSDLKINYNFVTETNNLAPKVKLRDASNQQQKCTFSNIKPYSAGIENTENFFSFGSEGSQSMQCKPKLTIGFETS